MGRWSAIKNEIVSILEGVSAIQNVSNYEKSTFSGFPAATVVPSEEESDFEATQERKRVYGFRIRIYVSIMSDQHEVSGEGLKEGERILENVTDTVINELDKPSNARLSNNADSTSQKVLYLEPVPSAWDYDEERNMIASEILLRVHVYVDTNQL